MVLSTAAEARQQRILLKRKLAKQENLELARRTEIEQDNKAPVKKEEDSTSSVSTHQDEEVTPEKKPRLETSNDSAATKAPNSDDKKTEEKKPELQIPSTRDIISNVFKYLSQEYKFLRTHNTDECDLRPLAAIRRRTAEATGFSKDFVKKIVMEDQAIMAENRRKRNNQEQWYKESDYCKSRTR